MHLMLLACAQPTLTEGRYAFTLEAFENDTCGMGEPSRDEVTLTWSQDAMTTTDDEDLAIHYAVDGEVLSAQYAVPGSVSGSGSCTFEIGNDETGSIASETRFLLDVETVVDSTGGVCTLPLPCSFHSSWAVERTGD